ncbi:MAG: HAMP domain-containing histidine kinase [Eubacterium sp.]|nr:HAMP domain-containing histidine kinase [Eubacterium sp.]
MKQSEMWGISLENSLVSKIFAKTMFVAVCSSIVTVLVICTVFVVTKEIPLHQLLQFCGRYFYQFFIMLFIITAIALVSAYALARKIVKPIEKMGEDLKHIDENCPYDELKPFSEKIKTQLDKKARLENLAKQFTANLSHELKTPLTAISGYGEILENTSVSPEDASRFGGIIYKESQRLINLTHDIIQLSQLEEYDFKPIVDTVDLAEIAFSCVEALSVGAQKRDIKLHVDGNEAFIRASKSLLDELVYNLVENAIRYNVDGGEVFVTVENKEKEIVLAVRDTGIGIPESAQGRIFERFFRVDKSRSKQTGGTGLGLAIVKHSAEYLGGSVQLESKENVGTTITVFLPKK